MSNKTLGIAGMLLGAGIVVSNLLVGIFGWRWLYYQLGYPSAGFGWRKITLIFLGLIIAIIGIILYTAAKKARKSE